MEGGLYTACVIFAMDIPIIDLWIGRRVGVWHHAILGLELAISMTLLAAINGRQQRHGDREFEAQDRMMPDTNPPTDPEIDYGDIHGEDHTRRIQPAFHRPIELQPPRRFRHGSHIPLL